MTYRLEHFLSKIESPIIAIFPDGEMELKNGRELAGKKFERCFLVESISVKNERVVIQFQENRRINSVNWAGGAMKERTFF